MQRTTTNRATRQRSLRALTTLTALMTLGLGASVSLGDHDRPEGHGYGHGGKQVGHAYEACTRCDRRDYHSHDNGGTLWVGGNRFGVSDGPGAIEYLAGELRRQGYRVKRYGNELRVSSRHTLGDIRFSNGKFRTVVTDRDRCNATIRFFQVRNTRPVIVDPGYGRGRDRGTGRGRGHDGWSRPVVTRPVIGGSYRRGDDCRRSGTTISFRW